ncbi:MAG TPA: acylneuraminate cytidylyltransferase family protein, partial [Rheinheimera sp.]|nr:acylneuraminate cytidylyltransferase family protein [Rheinheimera sp.]
IEIAKQVSDIARIFVSTDCDDIANSAIAAGATVIKRPAELASDTAPEWAAWQHAISYVRQHYGDFDTFVSLPATSPLRSEADVRNAIVQLHKSDADLCLAVTPANRNPYFNMVTRGNNGLVRLVSSLPDGVHRRQDSPAVYDITTVVYAARPDFIMQNTALFNGNITSIEVPKQRAVDVDDIYDFMLAEAILKVEQHAEE